MEKETKECKFKIHGNVSVGTKGQIVIPKNVRDIINVNPGDELIVFTKGEMAIGLIKAEDLNKLVLYIQSEMDGQIEC